MKITIRMDDITPDMDWESFEAFERMFRKYGIRPLLGVVPDNRDPKLSVDAPRAEFWERMRALQKEGWSLSMHGCHHVYHTKKGGQFPLNPQSEFAGRSRAEQERLLSDGKRILEEHGICTDIFMAPGHTFDRNTLRALKELGFSYVTDGFGKQPYVRHGMTFLPIAFLRKFAFSTKEGIMTIVIHANHSAKEELEGYDRMFAANRDSFVPYSEFLSLACGAERQGCAARAAEYGKALLKQWAARAKRLRHREKAVAKGCSAEDEQS